MNKYTVALTFKYSDCVEVEADNEDEAIELAMELSNPEYDYWESADILDIEELSEDE